MFFDPGRLKAIGFIRKAHSFDGEIKLIIEDKETINKEEPVFLKPGGKPVPFFITQFRGNYPEYIVRIEGIEADAIPRYQGMTIYQAGESTTDSDWDISGYSLFNGDELVGKVIGILERNMQDLLEIQVDDQTLLVPVVEDLIREVDHDEKRIYMDLPDGLLEL